MLPGRTTGATDGAAHHAAAATPTNAASAQNAPRHPPRARGERRHRNERHSAAQRESAAVQTEREVIAPVAVEPGEIARAGDECERRPDALRRLRRKGDPVDRRGREEDRPGSRHRQSAGDHPLWTDPVRETSRQERRGHVRAEERGGEQARAEVVEPKVRGHERDERCVIGVGEAERDRGERKKGDA